eukprot:786617-Rhodomonas_salina.1
MRNEVSMSGGVSMSDERTLSRCALRSRAGPRSSGSGRVLKRLARSERGRRERERGGRAVALVG